MYVKSITIKRNPVSSIKKFSVVASIQKGDSTFTVPLDESNVIADLKNTLMFYMKDPESLQLDVQEKLMCVI